MNYRSLGNGINGAVECIDTLANILALTLGTSVTQTTVPTGSKARPTDVAGCTLEMGADGLWTGNLGTLTQAQVAELTITNLANWSYTSAETGDVRFPGSVLGKDFSLHLPSTNILDWFAPSGIYGYYVNQNSGENTIYPGGDFFASGYIPVKPSTRYTRESSGDQYAFYTAAKVFISGGILSSFVTPSNAAFIRISLYASHTETSWLVEGLTPPSTIVHNGLNVPNSQAYEFGQGCIFNQSSLRGTKRKTAMLSLGVPTQLGFNLIGDSYTHQANRWAQGFATLMTQKYGDAGGGWCGFGFLDTSSGPYNVGNQPPYLNGNARPSIYPVVANGSISSTYATAESPDLASAHLGAGSYYTIRFPTTPLHTTIDVVYIGVSGASISWKFDTDGSPTTVSVDTNGTNKITLVVPSAATLLTISQISGTPNICGAYLRTAASGVVVNKLAATGSSIYFWGSASAKFDTPFGWSNADCTVIMDGPNDQYTSVTPAYRRSQMLKFIVRVKAILPGSDVLVATPPENLMGYGVKMSEYAASDNAYSAFGRYCHLNLQNYFGDPTNTAEYGSTGTYPLFLADNLHPNPNTGGYLLLQGILDAIGVS